MASISDLIMQQVNSAAGKVNIPSDIKNQVLGGLSESILGSLTQTATQAGGIDQIKSMLTGKTSAASSPVTNLASKLFSNNVISRLKLGATTGSALTGLIPGIMGKLSNVFKDLDGDGDVDLNDFLLALKGGNAGNASILGTAAKSILGGLFGKK